MKKNIRQARVLAVGQHTTIVVCPFCTLLHVHGIPEHGNTLRVSHCADQRGSYLLIGADAPLTDYATADREYRRRLRADQFAPHPREEARRRAWTTSVTS